jgi:hypothetical protein
MRSSPRPRPGRGLPDQIEGAPDNGQQSRPADGGSTVAGSLSNCIYLGMIDVTHNQSLAPRPSP